MMMATGMIILIIHPVHAAMLFEIEPGFADSPHILVVTAAAPVTPVVDMVLEGLPWRIPEALTSPYDEEEQPEDLAMFGRRLRARGQHHQPKLNRRTMFCKSGYLPQRIRAKRRAA